MMMEATIQVDGLGNSLRAVVLSLYFQLEGGKSSLVGSSSSFRQICSKMNYSERMSFVPSPITKNKRKETYDKQCHSTKAHIFKRNQSSCHPASPSPMRRRLQLPTEACEWLRQHLLCMVPYKKK